ncbi:hypothetical protein [Niallia sp. FSL R7-0271]|uniref:hypothetical protein n=1 Tax=Niallia sp. FSL R7-0271 TaxID=2921678 RepID=UPI0030F7D8BF
MQEAFDVVEEKFGGIDVVFNTAVIMLLSSIAELNSAELCKMHRTIISRTFIISQQAERCVRKGGEIHLFELKNDAIYEKLQLNIKQQKITRTNIE